MLQSAWRAELGAAGFRGHGAAALGGRAAFFAPFFGRPGTTTNKRVDEMITAFEVGAIFRINVRNAPKATDSHPETD